jgi:hypothetical protein
LSSFRINWYHRLQRSSFIGWFDCNDKFTQFSSRLSSQLCGEFYIEERLIEIEQTTNVLSCKKIEYLQQIDGPYYHVGELVVSELK